MCQIGLGFIYSLVYGVLRENNFRDFADTFLKPGLVCFSAAGAHGGGGVEGEAGGGDVSLHT